MIEDELRAAAKLLLAPWSDKSGECWQCHCVRRGSQHTNGPCRCTPEWKEVYLAAKKLLEGEREKRCSKQALSIVRDETALDETYRIMQDGKKYPIGNVYYNVVGITRPLAPRVYIDDALTVEEMETIIGAVKTFLAGRVSEEI